MLSVSDDVTCKAVFPQLNMNFTFYTKSGKISGMFRNSWNLNLSYGLCFWEFIYSFPSPWVLYESWTNFKTLIRCQFQSENFPYPSIRIELYIIIIAGPILYYAITIMVLFSKWYIVFKRIKKDFGSCNGRVTLQMKLSLIETTRNTGKIYKTSLWRHWRDTKA